jgi:hypothetical protein
VPPASSSDRVLIIRLTPAEGSAGYGFLFWPPDRGTGWLGAYHDYKADRIDVTRLALQWVLLLVVTVPWYLSVRDSTLAQPAVAGKAPE